MSKNFYAEQPYIIRNTNNYYIHNHVDNIGKLQGGSFNDIFSTFNEQKKQAASEAVKNQYKSLLTNRHNMGSTDKEGQDFINQLLDPNRGDELVSELNKALSEELDKIADSKNIIKLLDAVKNKEVRTPKGKIEDNLKELCGQLNDILEVVRAGLEIYQRDGKNLLTGLAYKQQYTREDYGKHLENKIKELKKQLSKQGTFNLNEEQIDQIISNLQILADVLKTGVTKSSGETLTFGAIKHIFNQNILSTGLGEAIAFKTEDLAESTLLNFLVDENNINQSIESTGTSTFKIHMTDSQGRPLNKTEGKKTFGKTDIKLNNIYLSLSDISGEYDGLLELTLGISNKLYQSVKYNTTNPTGQGEFEVGRGLTVDQGLRMLLTSKRDFYLAYNILGWNNNPKVAQAVSNLQDALFTRSVIYLFGSRGGPEDFAGFLLLNGKITPLWDVILYVIQNNVGKTHSLQQKMSENNRGAISFSLGTKEQRLAMTSFQYMHANPKMRSQLVNDAVRASSMAGYIRPAKLAQALNK